MRKRKRVEKGRDEDFAHNGGFFFPATNPDPFFPGIVMRRGAIMRKNTPPPGGLALNAGATGDEPIAGLSLA